MRAADGGESARFTGSFLASSFSRSQAFIYLRLLSAANASRWAPLSKMTKMKIKSISEIPITILVLAACAPATPFSATATVPVQIASVTDTSVPTSVPTATSLVANWEAAKNCVIEYKEQPEESQLEGVAALLSLSSTVIARELSLLDLKDGTSTKIDTSNQSIDILEVSPDRHTLAYTWFNNSTEKWELVFIDSVGHRQRVAWSSEQGFFFQDWLNNHQLLIRQDSVYLVVDPYKESQVSIAPSDFPDFNSWDLKAFLSFDPSLSKVIYKSYAHIKILDLDSNTAITSLIDGIDRVLIVKWSFSGERAAVVATVSSEQKSDGFGLPNEIFVVEKNGQVRQLTHLFDTFGLPLEIDSISWSPDGSKIAFWIDDTGMDTTLMVADYETGSIVNYCIGNIFESAFPSRVSAPIWSPDGKYMMIENRYESDKNKVLIVDISNHYAFPIAENASPVGWMAEGQ